MQKLTEAAFILAFTPRMETKLPGTSSQDPVALADLSSSSKANDNASVVHNPIFHLANIAFILARMTLRAIFADQRPELPFCTPYLAPGLPAKNAWDMGMVTGIRGGLDMFRMFLVTECSRSTKAAGHSQAACNFKPLDPRRLDRLRFPCSTTPRQHTCVIHPPIRALRPVQGHPC